MNRIQLQLVVTLLLASCVRSIFSFTKNILPKRVTTNNKMTSLQAQHKVGFIGCGTIAAAIATGLATTDGLVSSIAVSRRSKAKSDALQQNFPDLVTVHENNQDILDRSDIVFITVLPEQASEVLQSLQFDSERHHLVSLVVRICDGIEFYCSAVKCSV